MTPLRITVVIEGSTPQQWVVQTLQLLQQHALLRIQNIVIQPFVGLSNDQRNANASANQISETASPFYRVTKHVLNALHSYIDSVQFPTDSIERSTLPEALSALQVEPHKQTTTVDKTDIVVHLGNSDSPLPYELPDALHGIWVVNANEINNQITNNYLHRPAIHWIHLWKWEDQQGLNRKRIASHALPLQSFSKTDMRTYTFGSLPELILSRLNWLAQGKDPYQFEADQIDKRLYAQDAFPDTVNNNSITESQYFFYTLRLLLTQSKERLRRRLRTDQWQLGFLCSTDHVSSKTLREFQQITPPDDIIWADPQVIETQGKTHVFFEELEIKENKGRIVHAVLTPNGFDTPPTTVIDEPHHLSYPFIFEDEGTFYLVPETSSRRTISLYKATTFPEKWEHAIDLMTDINAADSTLLRHDGLWWLFTNAMSYDAVDERDQLLLFYSENLLTTDWQPHPLNPVVTGIDRSRMAGAFYEKNGELFRTSQYGANRYGYGVNTSRVSTLTTTDYRETLIDRITPSESSNWLGCHTAIHTDQTIIIDRLQSVRKRLIPNYRDRLLRR